MNPRVDAPDTRQRYSASRLRCWPSRRLDGSATPRGARSGGCRGASRSADGCASTRTEVSISVLPTVFAAAVFGPLAGMIVAVGVVPRRLPVRCSAARRGEGTPGTNLFQMGRLHMHPCDLRRGGRLRRTRCSRLFTRRDDSARRRDRYSGIRRGAARLAFARSDAQAPRRQALGILSECAHRCTWSRCASTRRSSRP